MDLLQLPCTLLYPPPPAGVDTDIFLRLKGNSKEVAAEEDWSREKNAESSHIKKDGKRKKEGGKSLVLFPTDVAEKGKSGKL